MCIVVEHIRNNIYVYIYFFFNDTATTEIYTLSLHDALPILLQTQTNQLLIDKAQNNSIVVRLKGGDPFIFGRGGEEMEELIKAGIPVEIVPGITSGIAAPAYAGIPLTHRLYSSSVTFVTGHEAVGKYNPKVNWEAIARGSQTIVIYMGIHNLKYIVEQLVMAGLSAQTPIALIRWGTRSQQEELIGSLETIIKQVDTSSFEAPAVIVIGKVINLSMRNFSTQKFSQ